MFRMRLRIQTASNVSAGVLRDSTASRIDTAQSRNTKKQPRAPSHRGWRKKSPPTNAQLKPDEVLRTPTNHRSNTDRRSPAMPPCNTLATLTFSSSLCNQTTSGNDSTSLRLFFDAGITTGLSTLSHSPLNALMSQLFISIVVVSTPFPSLPKPTPSTREREHILS
jgi:hypothetical protein